MKVSRMAIVRLLAVAAIIAAALVAFSRPAEAQAYVESGPQECLASLYPIDGRPRYDTRCVIRKEYQMWAGMRSYSDAGWQRIIDEFGVLRAFSFQRRWE